MRYLDPRNNDDRHEIMKDLIEEKMGELGVEEVFARVFEPKSPVETSIERSFTEIGSTPELNLMLTDFHFTQQIIFDFYDIDVEWEF